MSGIVIAATGIQLRSIEAAHRILKSGIFRKVADVLKRPQEHEGISIDQSNSVKVEDLHSTDLAVGDIKPVSNTELANEAGLKVLNGFTVYAYSSTLDTDVFAVGDCWTSRILGPDKPSACLRAWTFAGHIADHNMASNTINPCRSTPGIWPHKCDRVLQIARFPNPDQTFVKRSSGVNLHITFGISPDHHLAYAPGTAPDVKIPKDIRIATKIFEAQVCVTPEAFANPAVALKSVLRT